MTTRRKPTAGCSPAGRAAVCALAVMGVLLLTATGCGGTTTRERLSNTPATRDPAAIVDALDAAGLALCHTDYSDLAQYNIYGLFGAVSTQRYFPHHAALPIHSGNVESLSCVTPNQPDSGAIEIDVYPTPSRASEALRQVGQIWLAGWLYGNVAVLVDRAMPTPQSQQVGDVLERLPGAVAFRL